MGKNETAPFTVRPATAAEIDGPEFALPPKPVISIPPPPIRKPSPETGLPEGNPSHRSVPVTAANTRPIPAVAPPLSYHSAANPTRELPRAFVPQVSTPRVEVSQETRVRRKKPLAKAVAVVALVGVGIVVTPRLVDSAFHTEPQPKIAAGILDLSPEVFSGEGEEYPPEFQGDSLIRLDDLQGTETNQPDAELLPTPAVTDTKTTAPSTPTETASPDVSSPSNEATPSASVRTPELPKSTPTASSSPTNGPVLTPAPTETGGQQLPPLERLRTTFVAGKDYNFIQTHPWLENSLGQSAAELSVNGLDDGDIEEYFINAADIFGNPDFVGAAQPVLTPENLVGLNSNELAQAVVQGHEIALQVANNGTHWRKPQLDKLLRAVDLTDRAVKMDERLLNVADGKSLLSQENRTLDSRLVRIEGVGEALVVMVHGNYLGTPIVSTYALLGENDHWVSALLEHRVAGQ